MYLTITIIIILAIVLIFTWVVFNQLVTARESVHEALAGIDVQLKKRFELIPRLVEIVKGYSNYEADTLEKVTSMRSLSERDATENDMLQKEKEDAGLNLVSRSIKVTVEDYPELKANEHFLELMKELSSVEDELAMSRRYLNGTIRDYNTKIGVFPNVLLAGPFGFKERPFYEIDSFEREPHKIFE
ncbi:MAG TPA: LemA family protein [Brumimicrobium sp.]|nr:LemA family protein [Brumimicrobium sp.]